MNPKEQKIDRWLDAALKQYGAAHPSPGLEARVLVTVRAEMQHVPTRRKLWALAVASATAAAIIAVWLASSTSQGRNGQATLTSPPVSANHGKKPEAKTTALAGAGKGTVGLKSRRRTYLSIKHAAAQRPKFDQFPSPRTLSQEDKLLLMYVRQTPRDELASVIAQEKNVSDLYINDLEIPPLGGETPDPEIKERN